MRWRDVKQNRIPEKKEEKEEIQIDLNLPFASRFDRFKAFTTDSFLVAMPIFYIVFYVVFGSREAFAQNMLLGWIYILTPLAIIMTAFYAKAGQSPGMKAYEIEVIDNHTKQKPTIMTAFLRFFFFNISFFSVIGILLTFFREDQRSLHDILSGTSIINKEENQK